MTSVSLRAFSTIIVVALLILPCAYAAGPDKHERLPLKGKLIVIDAGHGGCDPGAVRNGVREKDITMDIVNELKATLESRGARVMRTRCSDDDIELDERAHFLGKTRADLFVSVHVNASPCSSKTSGIQTYFRTPHSRMLAHTMHSVLLRKLAAKDRGVHTASFWVLNSPAVPSLLLEVGYITNTADRRRLVQPAYHRKLSKAIADGIECYWLKKGLIGSQQQRRK